MAARQRDDQLDERFRAEAWPMLPALVRVARVLTGDPHAADDLVQETMLRAYRHIGSYRPGTNIKAWLMTILRRTHIDLHRKAARRIDAGSLDAMLQEPPAPAPESRAPDRETLWSDRPDLLEQVEDEALAEALRDLPDTARWTLLLVDVEQMSVDEAASALDVAPGTIKSRASRARAQLRQALLPYARRRGWTTDPQPGD